MSVFVCVWGMQALTKLYLYVGMKCVPRPLTLSACVCVCTRGSATDQNVFKWENWEHKMYAMQWRYGVMGFVSAVQCCMQCYGSTAMVRGTNAGTGTHACLWTSSNAIKIFSSRRSRTCAPVHIKYKIDAKELNMNEADDDDDDDDDKTQNVSDTCNRLLLVYDYKLIQLCSIAYVCYLDSVFTVDIGRAPENERVDAWTNEWLLVGLCASLNGSKVGINFLFVFQMKCDCMQFNPINKLYLYCVSGERVSVCNSSSSPTKTIHFQLKCIWILRMHACWITSSINAKIIYLLRLSVYSVWARSVSEHKQRYRCRRNRRIGLATECGK